MNTFKTIFLLLLTCILSVSAFGNGMGVYAISSAVRSSDPICREIKDITLLSEKLYINLKSGKSEIAVKYVLWNDSDKDYDDIDYAFPIDYVIVGQWYKLPRIKRVEFFCNDKPLEFTQSQDTLIAQSDLDSIKSLFEDFFFDARNLCRRWYYTKFSIKKQSFAYLEVKYTLSNLLLSDGASPLNIPDFNTSDQYSLVYDFSPASSWGDGIIRDFYVEINGHELLLAGENVEWIIDHENDNDNSYQWNKPIVKGLDFQSQGDRLVYHTRNFNLKNAAPLFIHYLAGYHSLDLLMKNMLAPSVYSVTVSSEQARYPKSALGDMNLETAWVGKKGDWIEFSFERFSDLLGFCILNGYHKSAETYEQNNRVKTIKMEIFRSEDEVATNYLEFQDNPYKLVSFDNFPREIYYYDFFDDTINEKDNPKSRKKIRFTIEDIYPGTKYDDTCISEIIFFNGRDSGPELFEEWENELVWLQNSIAGAYKKNLFDPENEKEQYDDYKSMVNSWHELFDDIISNYFWRDKSMQYQMTELAKVPGVKIVGSPDNKFRILTRSTYLGDSSPTLCSYVQYMDNGDSYYGYLRKMKGDKKFNFWQDSNDYDLYYDSIYTFSDAGKQYYFLAGQTINSLPYKIYKLQAVSIFEGEIKEEAIFLTEGGLSNEVSILYENNNSPHPCIVFDASKKEVHQPEVVYSAGTSYASPTGKVITYKWSDGAFRKE